MPNSPSSAVPEATPRHRTEATAGRGELANLDTLRTFAVLSVLIDHLSLTLNALYLHNEALQQFAFRLGRLGVVAFFVHTSLVLMFSLERLHRESPRPTLAFYLRRAFRIYPLSLLIVVFVSIFQIPDLPFGSSGPGRYSALNILSNLLLTQNFIGVTVTGPLWSLPFEVQMYMILPALYLLARRRGSTRPLVGLIAAFAVVGIALFESTGKLHFFAFIPCFLSGILAYSLRGRLRPVLPAVYWSFLVPGLLIAAAAAGVAWPGLQYYCGWLLSFCLGGSVYLFHDSTNAAWNAVTKNVAKYSYGLYLLHVPSLWLVFQILGIRGVSAVVVWVLVVAASSVAIFHGIEDPLIRYGKKLTRKVAGTLKARSAAA
jgi:peptidoglycan/LPS O-acetylase OafA/YrhL